MNQGHITLLKYNLKCAVLYGYLTDVFLLLYQVCGCPEASSHSKCTYLFINFSFFAVEGRRVPNIINPPVCFVTRADTCLF